MALILAIEPDRRQASRLASLSRGGLAAELLVTDSTDKALAALDGRVPDLILTSRLLSPKEEARLGELSGGEAHVPTLMIPVLAGSSPNANGKGGLLTRLRRGKSPSETEGCDPTIFAAEVAEYLERAESDRARRTIMGRDFAVPVSSVETATFSTAHAPVADDTQRYVTAADYAEGGRFDTVDSADAQPRLEDGTVARMLDLALAPAGMHVLDRIVEKVEIVEDVEVVEPADTVAPAESMEPMDMEPAGLGFMAEPLVSVLRPATAGHVAIAAAGDDGNLADDIDVGLDVNMDVALDVHALPSIAAAAVDAPDQMTASAPEVTEAVLPVVHETLPAPAPQQPASGEGLFARLFENVRDNLRDSFREHLESHALYATADSSVRLDLNGVSPAAPDAPGPIDDALSSPQEARGEWDDAASLEVVTDSSSDLDAAIDAFDLAAFVKQLEAVNAGRKDVGAEPAEIAEPADVQTIVPMVPVAAAVPSVPMDVVVPHHAFPESMDALDEAPDEPIDDRASDRAFDDLVQSFVDAFAELSPNVAGVAAVAAIPLSSLDAWHAPDAAGATGMSEAADPAEPAFDTPADGDFDDFVTALNSVHSSDRIDSVDTIDDEAAGPADANDAPAPVRHLDHAMPLSAAKAGWPPLQGEIAETDRGDEELLFFTRDDPEEAPRAHAVASAATPAPHLTLVPGLTAAAPVADGDLGPMTADEIALQTARRAAPAQDEWGFFDPDQCGFNALLAKLDEITQ